MTQRTSVIDPGPITPGLSITMSDKLFFHNLDNLKPSLQPIKGQYLSSIFSRFVKVYFYEKIIYKYKFIFSYRTERPRWTDITCR